MQCRALRGLSGTALALALAGCGGDSGTLASAPAPTATPSPSPAPTPSPTPTPPPPPAAALLVPVQAALPVSPTATATGPNFDDPRTRTVFPLMQTAIGRYTFGGDPETTNQGATMAVDPATGRFTLTVNNPALGIADRNMAEISNLSGNRILIVRTGTATSNADDLDYTMYGHWYTELVATDSLESAAWIGGYITPVSSIPVSGVGNFSGATRGLAYNALAPLSGYIDFDGKVQLAANFAARSITGSITDLTYGEERWELTGLAIGITATIDPARNLFAGTTRVTSATINIGLAPTTGAVGDIAGRFFGPSANEVGGVYTLSDGTRRMIGSFGAKQ